MSDIATFEDADQSDAPAPAPLPVPQPAPSAAPPAPPRHTSMLGLLPVAAVSLAALASAASAAGLIVATRNVSETQHVIAELARANGAGAKPASHEAPAPRLRPAVAMQADIAAARSALATIPPAASAEDGRYATITEMRAALGDLRQDLAKHQGPGNVMVMEAMRDGQTDLANRISDLAAKVDRLERTLNSSRKAHP